MNKFRKCLKFLYVLVISSLMLLVSATTGFASEASDPLIKVEFNPVPVLTTVGVIFFLFFAVVALMYFLYRHMSEQGNRVNRLSKIESEETIQLYDDLEDAKWNKEIIPDDKPRDVLLDDDYSRNVKTNHTAEKEPYEEPRHGPVPERDMPGYDPHAGEEDDSPKPLSPMPTPPNQRAAGTYSQPQNPPSQVQGGMYGAPMYPYAPAAQPPQAPRVYRPDSDVEIIMHDASAKPAEVHTPSGVTAPARPKVRAYRRRGRPAMYNAPSSVSYTPEYTQVPEETVVFGENMPRYNMRHLNIGPLGNAGGERAAVSEEPKTYTFNFTAPEEAHASEEPIREAPIIDPAAPVAKPASSSPEASVVRESAEYEKARVEIDPPRRGVNETIVVKLGDDLVDGKLMRTLDDVLDELGDADTTEIEAAIEPAYEEELLFLGADTLTSEDIPADEIFDDEEGEGRMFIDGKYTLVRYRTSFMSRFIQSEELIQDYYSVIKNVLMSYGGVIAEMGWSCETFKHEDKVCSKVNIKGKSLLLYLALDPEKYQNTKYHYSYIYDKYAKYKNGKVAMMVKVRSDRALKYALELIADMMEELGIVGGAIPDVDYRHAYESTEQLIARGLIKILPKDAEANAEAAAEDDVNVAEIIEHTAEAIPVELEDTSVYEFEEVTEEPNAEIAEEPVLNEEPELIEESATAEEPDEEPEHESEPELEIVTVPEVIHASASEVDELLTDEEAIEKIELVEDKEHPRNGKMCEVNLDTICDIFEDGDIVTLEELKHYRLVSRSAGRVKILARGTMTKTLTIYADRFSLQAVKMITLAGGHAEQYK